MAFQRIQGHLSFARKSWLFEDFQSLRDVSRNRRRRHAALRCGSMMVSRAAAALLFLLSGLWMFPFGIPSQRRAEPQGIRASAAGSRGV